MTAPKLSNDISRRAFLTLLGVAGAALATGLGSEQLLVVEAAEPPEPGTRDRPHRWAMVIDQAACVGCGHCSLACCAINDVPAEQPWNVIYADQPVDGEPVYLPRPCMHCANAPCVDVCPVGATYQRADGIVIMDYERCIGCRYCQVACPYDARSFNWQAFGGPNPAVPEWGTPEVARRPRGVAEKCTFCAHRIDRGLAAGLTPGVDRDATPACVNACPVRARIFGDLNDPESPVSVLLRANGSYRLREDLGAEPSVYYLPKRGATRPGAAEGARLDGGIA